MEHEQSSDLGVAERRGRLTAAREALEGLAGVLPRAAGRELPELMEELDALVALAGAGRVAVAAEAQARGEVAASQSAGLHGWVRDHAPSLRQGGSAALVRCLEAFGNALNAPVRDAVLTGRVDPAVGWAVVRNMQRLRGRIVEEADSTVTEAMLQVGAAWGPSMVSMLRLRLLAEHGADGELEEEQERAKRFLSLSHPVVDDDGVATYRLVLDAELTAVLEGAIGPFAAPVPGTDGAPDLRSPERRRAEALAAVCRRSVGAGNGLPVVPKASVVVTMDLRDLQERSGCGSVVGSPGPASFLSAEVVRRLGCDGEVVPAVLGGAGELLDLGLARRVFSRGQLRFLRLRDGGCTFPRCGAPAAWCDGHHVRHWADGGPSDVGNAALLCGRHHTVVHRDRLHATVTARGGGEHGAATRAVEWDLRPGSYDHALDRWRAEEADRKAAPVAADRSEDVPPVPLSLPLAMAPPHWMPPAPWDDPAWEPQGPDAEESWEDMDIPDWPDDLSA